ncbi:MAG: septum formation protein Maf [Clostridiales bacterium GWF2_36_10]|nr:MAG: septum formation protein Maf [Clostridiales bacterium GWF2_36_10]HAN22120.1 septum formation protein Maf [Clostridiales bacterium]
MFNRSIILASKSPRRREILKNAGYVFTVMEADTEENVPDLLSPSEAVIEIALQKALYVKEKLSTNNSIIIAADTMVFKNGILMGKPKDSEDAYYMLKQLSGDWHEVYSGYCIMSDEQKFTGCEITSVKFRTVLDKEINEYIRSGEPFDKAGAYGVQDRASTFVERIEGDFFNVMGLPICRISQILNTIASEIYT